VPIKISVKRKVVFNGKEYTSAADLPNDVRQAYERAVGRSAGALDQGTPPVTSIVFNGQTYGSVDEMPANVRRMYDAVLLTVEESDGAPSAAGQEAGGFPEVVRVAPAGTAPAPLVPESSSSRTLIIVAAAGLLLLVLYMLSSMSTTP
jgi:hypothetical protein